MLPLGMILGFGGYALSTWGYILVKGYNITLREWVSPFHPYTGTLASAGTVPKGSIFPTTGGAPAPGAGGPSNPIQRQQQQNLKTAPNPHGFVQ